MNTFNSRPSDRGPRGPRTERGPSDGRGPRTDRPRDGARNDRGLRVEPSGPRLLKPPTARHIALEALSRVDDGAFANLALPELFRQLEMKEAGYERLDYREKAFATELLYGTVRMRRACAWLASQYVTREPEGDTERCLHLGIYQLVFLGTPSHAAVAATVPCAPEWSRGFMNAVLRRIATDVEAANAGERSLSWPSLAVELSYPDWIVSAFERDLGKEVAHEALWRMNEAAVVHRRADGYVQDPASQMVAEAVEAHEGERILDMCAAPGGKTTVMATTGAHVVAVDIHEHRCQLVRENADELGLTDRIEVHCLDATALPLELVSEGFDRVLLDAPCSGLGSLRRRPDARWRIGPDDVDGLVDLQRALFTAAVAAVKPGGTLVYSVCTLTDSETVGIDRWAEQEFPTLEAVVPVAGDGWDAHGRGVRILPADTDGMCIFRYTKR